MGEEEPVCKKESNIIHTVAEGIELMHLVDRENICILADYFHMENENEQPDILEQCGSELAHIHFSPIEPRALPLVLDENMKCFLKQLKKTGYEKRISLEARANSLDEMSAACSAIRDYWIQST